MKILVSDTVGFMAFNVVKKLIECGDIKYINIYVTYSYLVRSLELFEINRILEKKLEQKRKEFINISVYFKIKQKFQQLEFLSIIRFLIFPYTKSKNSVIHCHERIRKFNEYK